MPFRSKWHTGCRFLRSSGRASVVVTGCLDAFANKPGGLGSRDEGFAGGFFRVWRGVFIRAYRGSSALEGCIVGGISEADNRLGGPLLCRYLLTDESESAEGGGRWDRPCAESASSDKPFWTVSVRQRTSGRRRFRRWTSGVPEVPFRRHRGHRHQRCRSRILWQGLGIGSGLRRMGPAERFQETQG